MLKRKVTYLTILSLNWIKFWRSKSKGINLRIKLNQMVNAYRTEMWGSGCGRHSVGSSQGTSTPLAAPTTAPTAASVRSSTANAKFGISCSKWCFLLKSGRGWGCVSFVHCLFDVCLQRLTEKLQSQINGHSSQPSTLKIMNVLDYVKVSTYKYEWEA